MNPTQGSRVEHDLLGTKEIPSSAYWGIHTLRAQENFISTGRRVRSSWVQSLAKVKHACVLANLEIGSIESEIAQALLEACIEVAHGKLEASFLTDALQGGAGTSLNMNMNEVLANRALEILGLSRGQYKKINPIEHVNLHQSTNDVVPTALKVACIGLFRDLSASIALLQGALQEKEREFATVVKMGRTEMQEAVPMTFGQEFSAWAEAISRDRWRTFKCEERLRVVNLGGTAIGTGLTAPREYIFSVIEKLREVTGLGLSRGENVPGETAHADVFVEVSAILKAHAVSLMKLADDLRKLNWLGELHLPALQAGSSIMPGKVNPVLCEQTIQVGLRVLANDSLVSECASRASFQICEFLPLLGESLLDSLELLIPLNRQLALHVKGIQVDAAFCLSRMNASSGILTAMVSKVGYERATELGIAFELERKQGSSLTLRSYLERECGADVVAIALSSERLTRLGE